MFWAHAEAKLGRSPLLAVEVAAHAIDMRYEWSKNTWRQVKASLLFYFERLATEDAMQAAAALRGTSQSACKTKSARTSGKRAKAVPSAALQEVLEAVSASGSVYAGLLERWLRLGSLFGLRPHEWCSAEVVYLTPAEAGDTPLPSAHRGSPDALAAYLRVRNAKATNGRSHGEFRHLRLSGADPVLIEEAATFCTQMAEIHDSGRYQVTYDGCRKLLLRINAAARRDGKGPWIQLYSARHHFSSSAKKSLDQAGVAAVLGHKTTKTAAQHYGKRRSGGSALGVLPVPMEVARVRIRRSRRNPEMATAAAKPPEAG